MIEQQTGIRKSYFKPIFPDPKLEKLDKNSINYKRRQKTRRCCICAETATKMLVHELEGCKRIERYCENCAVKAKQDILTRQSTSGI